MSHVRKALLLVCLVRFVDFSRSGNILIALSPMGGSRSLLLSELGEELHRRGNNITFLTSRLVNQNLLPRGDGIMFFQVDPPGADEALKDFHRFFKNIWTETGMPPMPQGLFDSLAGACEYFISDENEPLPFLLQQNFDMAIVDDFLNSCAIVAVDKLLQVPYIYFTATLMSTSLALATSNPLPISYSPIQMSANTDHMTFPQRVKNLIFLFINNHFGYKLTQEPIERAFQRIRPGTSASLADASRQAAIILHNVDSALEYPRPTFPNVIQVGGMHCKPGRRLSEDMEHFMQTSGPSDVILFNMGTTVSYKTAPGHIVDIFFRVFSSIPAKVVWKYDGPVPPNVSSKIKLVKWLPSQQNLLAHPQTKLFICHGGLNSILEAIYHGVPVLGIPMFGDQRDNMIRVEDKGMGIMLKKTDLSLTKFRSAILQALTEQKYKVKAKKLSKIMRDRPDAALERAVFWSEYVLRHGRDTWHLKSKPAQEISFIQYFLLDVFAVIATLSLLVFICCGCLLYYILQPLIKTLFWIHGIRIKIKIL